MNKHIPISGEAIHYVKKNHKLICNKFCNLEEYPSTKVPMTMFMAGSPGAGKTEYSKSFISIIQEKYPNEKIVRIDADDIRDMLPGYRGNNSHLFQSACNLAVEKLFDHVLKHNQNCVLDGTLSSLEVAKRNIDRSIKRKRSVGIVYIYLDPIIAWDFTKKREKVEGRAISKEVFIHDFFKARENVDKLKEMYGNMLELIVVIKKDTSHKFKSYFNPSQIDIGIKNEYTMGLLENALD